jgi:hypothetical protein
VVKVVPDRGDGGDTDSGAVLIVVTVVTVVIVVTQYGEEN